VANIDVSELPERINRALHRWPTVGLAVGVVADGHLAFFHGHGVADITTGTPVTEDTVFRIASVTKTFTAVAVMQLWERGLVDLDAPANDYLREFRLVPRRAGFSPATVRHLLTHTAGARAVRGPADLLRPGLGWEVPEGRSVPPLAEYYRGGLRLDTEPGTRWAYSNHGFAALGQIVEDVSGLPLERYFREHIFEPLRMESSDLVPSDRARSRLATGYRLRSGRFEAAAHRELATAGASSVYSTTGDMARYVAALLGASTNEHGSVLQSDSLAEMFRPHYQPDPRLPGMGLAFFREDHGGHRTVSHDGILEGFRSDMILAPGDGLGVLVFANTGGFDPRGVSVPVGQAVLRLLLGLPEDVIRTDVPERPWLWQDLCGWYSFGPGLLTDPQPRMALGPGLEVAVRRGQLILRGQTPIPAVRRGLRLYPDAEDPYAFRIDLSALGLDPSPIVFGRADDGVVTVLHAGLMPMSFSKRPDRLNPRRRIGRALAAGSAAMALRGLSRRRSRGTR
jgi:CubicO group peptidase (beta-lactamase class C family)